MARGEMKSSIGDKRKSSPKLRSQKELCFRHSEISHDINVYSLDAERADRLREVLQALYDVNKRLPIIVEGKRDVQALRKIGLAGEIITLHGGQGIYEFCEDLTERFSHVVLLMDWDDKGEKLFRSLADHLTGLWEEFAPLREILRVLCQKDIKDIEGMPGLLERLAGTAVTVGEETP
ncbi:MAG TPA: toprim domain-containing protein [Dissulfurispiraceae bacterium]|nr:toprim domain-containing protein [Dissulfurispiraceae bacterium]